MTAGISLSTERPGFAIKWTASVVQVLGYATTSLGVTPLNIYLFLVGVVGWFAVGVIWRDRAIMLIHLVALVALIGGLTLG